MKVIRTLLLMFLAIAALFNAPAPAFFGVTSLWRYAQSFVSTWLHLSSISSLWAQFSMRFASTQPIPEKSPTTPPVPLRPWLNEPAQNSTGQKPKDSPALQHPELPENPQERRLTVVANHLNSVDQPNKALSLHTISAKFADAVAGWYTGSSVVIDQAAQQTVDIEVSPEMAKRIEQLTDEALGAAHKALPNNSNGKPKLDNQLAHQLFGYESIEQYLDESDFEWQCKRLGRIIAAQFFDFSLTHTEGLLGDQSLRRWIKNNNLRLSTSSIMTNERTLFLENKYPYVFYHTTQPIRYLMAYFHTRLFEKLTGNVMPNFLFLRQPIKSMTLRTNDWLDTRIQLLNKGTQGIQYGDGSPFHRFCLLSVNPSFLAGAADQNESSLLHFIRNGDAMWSSFDNYSWDKLLNSFGLKDFHCDFSTVSYSKNNIMLQVALSSEVVCNAVYYSHCHGRKKIANILGNNSMQITTQKILNIFQTIPWLIEGGDTLAKDCQCRVILTPDLLLNPTEGPKHMQVYRYSKNDEALKTAEAQIDTIVEQLYQEIKATGMIDQVKHTMENLYITPETTASL